MVVPADVVPTAVRASCRCTAAVPSTMTNVSACAVRAGEEAAAPDTACVTGDDAGAAATVARAIETPMPASGINAVAISAVVQSAWRVAAVSDRVLVATRTSAARAPPRRTLARIARSATPTIASIITAVLWPCREARANGRAQRRRLPPTRAGSAPARAANRRRTATARASPRSAALRRVRRPFYR